MSRCTSAVLAPLAALFVCLVFAACADLSANPAPDGDAGLPSLHDEDGDTIADLHEGRAAGADTDRDGTPDYLDNDSDGDCIADAPEAGDADLNTPPVNSDDDPNPDFRDLDSDNDGLADSFEDSNCNGLVDPGETNPRDADSDNDGVSDLVEVGAGTNPNDPMDNPRNNGDFVFVEPYQKPQSPASDRLDFSTNFQSVDVYILEDVSASMQDEISSIRNGLITMINEITCQPGENPAVDFCIPDVETGAGQFGRSGQTWSHLKDISANHGATQSALPATASGGNEQHVQAMRGTISGMCASAATRTGTACFRDNALRVIVLVSDEDFREDTTWGSRQATYDALAGAGVRVIGVTGNHAEVPNLQADFVNMRGGTPAVNLVPAITATPNTTQCNALGGSPFFNSRAIVSGPDAQAGNALTCALQAVTAFLPQNVSAELVNDPANRDAMGNSVDAVASFVDHIEVFQDGSPECSQGNSAADSNGDGHADTFIGILPGTPVCWKLFSRQNDTVRGDPNGPQLFRATVEVRGEGGALLDSREVFFLVPQAIPDVIIG